MALVGHLIIRIVAILFGLTLAMLAAGLFIAFGAYFGALTEFFGELQAIFLDDPYYADEAGDPAPLVALLTIIFGVLTSFEAMSLAAMPSMIAIVLAEAFRWRGMTVNLVLGGAVAFTTGMTTLADRFGDGIPSQGTLVVLLATGFIGGFAYWGIAGRNAGRWLERTGSPNPVR